MGDQRPPGNKAKKTVQPMSQYTTCKSVHKGPFKCFLKHREKQLKLPTSLEGQQRLFIEEQLDDFKNGATSCERRTPRNPEGSFFPMISYGAYSPVTESKKKLPEDTEPLRPLLPSASTTHRSFWENIGAPQKQHLLAPWPRVEDSSADRLIKILEAPKPSWKTANKWPWEEQRKTTKQATNFEKSSHRRLSLESHGVPWSYQGTWFHDDEQRNQDMLSSIYYRYIYKGEDNFCESVERFRDSSITQQFDLGSENQLSHEESPVKTSGLVSADVMYQKRMSKVKDNRLSKQESRFEMKLQKPQDPYKTNKEIRLETSSLKYNQSKTSQNEGILTNTNDSLELQDKSIDKVKIHEKIHDPTALRKFISQFDCTPSILEQMFMGKGWDYNRVNTPISKMLNDCEWFIQRDDDENCDYDDDDGDEEKKEQEVKEHY